MPVVTKEQALELLTNEVQKHFDADELLEVYDEVFPDHPYPEEEASKDPTPLIEELVEHIQGESRIEEVLDLWGLIFPRHRNVWYNEEEERIHYNEEAEALSAE